MRVRVQGRADGDSQAGMAAGKPLRDGVGHRAEMLVVADMFVIGDQTHMAPVGMRVHFVRRHGMVTDGPFMETKELIG